MQTEGEENKKRGNKGTELVAILGGGYAHGLKKMQLALPFYWRRFPICFACGAVHVRASCAMSDVVCDS